MRLFYVGTDLLKISIETMAQIILTNTKGEGVGSTS